MGARTGVSEDEEFHFFLQGAISRQIRGGVTEKKGT